MRVVLKEAVDVAFDSLLFQVDALLIFCRPHPVFRCLFAGRLDQFFDLCKIALKLANLAEVVCLPRAFQHVFGEWFRDELQGHGHGIAPKRRLLPLPLSLELLRKNLPVAPSLANGPSRLGDRRNNEQHDPCRSFHDVSFPVL